MTVPLTGWARTRIAILDSFQLPQLEWVLQDIPHNASNGGCLELAPRSADQGAGVFENHPSHDVDMLVKDRYNARCKTLDL
jgi:hypothetical protein